MLIVVAEAGYTTIGVLGPVGQGERAVDRVLDTVHDVLSRFPREHHGHRLEHNALIRNGQIERAQGLGVELSFFERLTPHRAHRQSCDPIGPFRALRTAILRLPRSGGPALGPDEAVSVEEALQAMTTNVARQLGVADHRGSLEVGKAAIATRAVRVWAAR